MEQYAADLRFAPPLIEGPFRPQLTGAQMPSVGQLLGQHKKLPLS